MFEASLSFFASLQPAVSATITVQDQYIFKENVLIFVNLSLLCCTAVREAIVFVMAHYILLARLFLSSPLPLSPSYTHTNQR